MTKKSPDPCQIGYFLFGGFVGFGQRGCLYYGVYPLKIQLKELGPANYSDLRPDIGQSFLDRFELGALEIKSRLMLLALSDMKQTVVKGSFKFTLFCWNGG